MTSIEEVTIFGELIMAKARFCRLVDAKNWSELGDMLTADVELDGLSVQPAQLVSGRDEVLESIESTLADATTAHHVHPPELYVDGDDARLIWPMQYRIVWADGRTLTGYGHHHEHWVQRVGEWKIRSLRSTTLIVDVTAPDNG